MNKERLLKFLGDWRKRLLKIPMDVLPDEQFGQLVTLNTLISFVEDGRSSQANPPLKDGERLNLRCLPEPYNVNMLRAAVRNLGSPEHTETLRLMIEALHL